MQAAFYGTAILYSVTLVPVHYQKWLLLNPMAQIIQDARYSVVTRSSVTVWHTLHSYRVFIPFAAIVIVGAVAVLYFKRQSKYFAENI